MIICKPPGSQLSLYFRARSKTSERSKRPFAQMRETQPLITCWGRGILHAKKRKTLLANGNKRESLTPKYRYWKPVSDWHCYT